MNMWTKSIFKFLVKLIEIKNVCVSNEAGIMSAYKENIKWAKNAKWSCKLFQGWIKGGEKSGGVTRQK